MPHTYSPYKTRLGRAIEKGQGVQELTNQAVFTLGRVKYRVKSLNSRQGWKEMLDLVKDEPFVPFPLRTKISIAQKVALDIGFFMDKYPNATAEDIRVEVDRLVQEAELGKQLKEAEQDSRNQTEPTLRDQKAVKELLEEIERDPEKTSKNLVAVFKRATSLAAHENMKDYTKHIAMLVPFPWNMKFAAFTATYHLRLAGMSVVNHFRKTPVPKEELERGLYKNHLSRALEHVANGVGESGSVLIPYLRKIPGIGYLSNYVLRNSIGKMLKYTADVLEEDTKEIQGSVKKILERTMHKDSFDKDTVAMMVAMGVNNLANIETTAFAKDMAVSYRYSRISKTINLADEMARATIGYAMNGAPSEEKRRDNFLKAQGKKEAEENLRRNQRARETLRRAHRMPRPQSSLLITPLNSNFAKYGAGDRRSSMRIDTRMENGMIDTQSSSYERELEIFLDKS